jgi:site-specific DNA recombinase
MTHTCVLYARVSNKSQAERGLSLPGQLRELRAWAEREGFRVVEEVSDTGGKDSKRDVLDRPGINKILDLCERQRVDVVIAQSRDRFGEHPIPDLLGWQLRTFGTRLRTPDDPGDEEDEGGELVRLISDWNSRRERRTTAKRSRSRKLEHVRRGYVIAGHTAPYGFRFAGDKEKRTLEVEPEHIAVARRIFELIAVEGQGVHGVKKALDRDGVPTPPNPTKAKHPEHGRFWSRQFIRNVVASDVYKSHSREELAALVAGGYMAQEVADKAPEPCGVWWYQGTDFAGETHRVAVPIPDAGIAREWVDAARAALRDNIPTRRAVHRTYELSGLAYCDLCGRRMQSHTYTKKNGAHFHYYECATSAEDGKRGCPQTGRLRAQAVEETVWDFVAGLLSDPAAIVAGLDRAIEQERQRLRLDPAREEMALLDRRAVLEEERRGYLRQNARGVISDAELDEMLAGLEEQRGEIERAIQDLRGRGERLRRLEAVRAGFAGDLVQQAFGDQIKSDKGAQAALDALMAGQQEHALARQKTLLERYTPEQRHARYRELELKVIARGKDELEITGVFGTELVSVGVPSRC